MLVKSSPRPIKVGLISLGCAKNLVDSELMLGALSREGMELVADPRLADVLIVNTCGFIEPAKKESIAAILRAAELRKSGKGHALIVAGCLPQRYPKQLPQELPEVDAFIGLNEAPRIGTIVRDVLARRNDGTPQLFWSGPAKYIPDYGAPRFRLTPHHSAYVKIAEGCDHPCSFCSLPRIRGRHRSRPLKDVLAEVRALVGDGVREINLISQDTTSYGKDLTRGKSLLSELLREVQGLDGDFWVRVLYTHPAYWTDELIETIAACGKVCRYVDMPLQHINNEILRRMRREIGSQQIRDLIEKIRSSIPDVALRTTFIVGFPGETEAQVAELLKFIAATRLERLGVFVYSPEDNTVAGRMHGQLPARVKQQRRRRVMMLQQQISRELHQTLVGRTLRVLVEKRTPRGFVGRTMADAPEIDGTVRIRGAARVGEFVKVRITGATEYDLVGVCEG
ncbi:MAG: 30S ribosomal protein S12 methylthiotransferase RimO [Verrucomicrobiia bacterium]